MSSFDKRDFVLLDPGVIRVKLMVPQGFRLDVARSWLGVELSSGEHSHQSRFELMPEKESFTTLPGGIFSEAAPGLEYVLQLAPSSQLKFVELQRFVSRGRMDGVLIRVVPALAASPADTQTVDVWIELLLNREQGYFTLVDGASLELDRLRSPRADADP